MMKINAKGLDHRELNSRIRAAIEAGHEVLQLDHVNGQRYIGAGLRSKTRIIINGVPGNDLAAFMDGPEIIVNGNGQDAAGNTMNAGKIVIHGAARDLIGYAMRGGKIFIRGSVGYRVGIHMKSYKDQVPVLVIGGAAKDFLGEYMAGGIIALLGLDQGDRHLDPGAKRLDSGEGRAIRAGIKMPVTLTVNAIAGQAVGTGMHGGCIFVRGSIPEENLGKEVKAFPLTHEDKDVLDPILREYGAAFGLDLKQIVQVEGREAYESFTKLAPVTHRPYERMYAY